MPKISAHNIFPHGIREFAIILESLTLKRKEK